MITKAYPYVECVCIFVNLAICPDFFLRFVEKGSMKLCRVILFLNTRQYIFKAIVLCIAYALVLTSDAYVLLYTSKMMNNPNV